MSEPTTQDEERSEESIRALKRAVRAARGQTDDQQIVIVERPAKDNGNGSFAKLRDAILPIAVAGLVATVWNMSINMAKLETTVESLVVEIKELKLRIKP